MSGNRFDLTIQALHGQASLTDPPVFSMWKHFPSKDRSVRDSVEAHVTFQERHRSDLIKISPHGRYCVVDWGCEISHDVQPDTGSTYVTRHAINSLEDWERIDEVDPLDGELGWQVRIVEELARKYANSYPMMMTLFLPTMVADKLAPKGLFLQHLREDPKLVKDRVQVITKVKTEWGRACLDAGADGLFLATQHAQPLANWGVPEWRKWVVPLNKPLISTLSKKAEFLVAHLHGSDVFFGPVVAEYPVTAVNWHATETSPSLAEAGKIKHFSGGLLGGLGEPDLEELAETKEDVTTFLQERLAEARGLLGRVILAPGCVVPLSVPDERLDVLSAALRDLPPP